MANNQEPIRRNDVIRCEQCGEDYSITYKRCPFCDERPDRPTVAGRRVSGGGKGGANPLHMIGLVASLGLIAAAAVIVFTTVSPLLGSKEPKPDPSVSVSTPDISLPDVSAPDTSTPDVILPGVSLPDASEPDVSQPDVNVPDVSEPEPPVVSQSVTSIELSKSDFTLQANETYTFKVTTNPADAKVTWSSSNESAAVISADGVVTNVNKGSSQVKVTITATAGDKTAECTVYCRGGSSGNVKPSTPTTPTTPSTPSGSGSSGSVVNKTGKISGAGSGLNVRSGPGSSNEALASLNNGVSVTILEDTGTGWYKIAYSGVGGKTATGYVSKDYVTLD